MEEFLSRDIFEKTEDSIYDLLGMHMEFNGLEQTMVYMHMRAYYIVLAKLYIKKFDKKIEFEIQNPNANICDWMNDYNQWHIDKDKNLWENNKEGHGIVGLDYSSIPQKLRNMDVPTLRRWSNQLTFGHNYKGESNITLRIIKQVEL